MDAHCSVGQVWGIQSKLDDNNLFKSAELNSKNIIMRLSRATVQISANFYSSIFTKSKNLLLEMNEESKIKLCRLIRIKFNTKCILSIHSHPFILLSSFLRHHFHKFLKVNCSISIVVSFSDHCINFIFAGLFS